METLKTLARHYDRLAGVVSREASEHGEDATLLHVVAFCEGYALDFNAPLNARKEITREARAMGAVVELQII